MNQAQSIRHKDSFASIHHRTIDIVYATIGLKNLELFYTFFMSVVDVVVL